MCINMEELQRARRTALSKSKTLTLGRDDASGSPQWSSPLPKVKKKPMARANCKDLNTDPEPTGFFGQNVMQGILKQTQAFEEDFDMVSSDVHEDTNSRLDRSH